jgi:CRP-like cAMP-binding protein
MRDEQRVQQESVLLKVEGSSSGMTLVGCCELGYNQHAGSALREGTGRRNVSQDRSNKFGYLQMVDIFQDLTEEEIEEIDRATTLSSCRRGKIFYMPEDTSEVLFLLKEGRVQLYRISPDGKKLVIATIGPGTVFGEMALIGQGMHNTFAEAVENCELLVMSREDVERLLVTKPKVALRIFEALGTRLRETEARLEEIAFKGIPARLASLLLQLADEGGSDTVSGMTHQDLGEQIGTYRETTTQTLNAFKAEGLIDIGRKRITILDREGLQRIAEG